MKKSKDKNTDTQKHERKLTQEERIRKIAEKGIGNEGGGPGDVPEDVKHISADLGE